MENVLSDKLNENLMLLDLKLNTFADLIKHHFFLDSQETLEGCMLRIEGITDEQKLMEYSLAPLLQHSLADEKEQNLLEDISKRLIAYDQVKTVTKISECVASLLEGSAVLFIDSLSSAIIVSASGGEKRSISEPTSQMVIRGTKEGFVETTRSNTALVRRRLRTPQLKLESFTVGEFSHTKVEIMYLENKADHKALQTIRQRLTSETTNIIIESGYIEKILQDKQTTLFPTINYTERPDETAGSLLAGRIAIFTDGTPFVLLAPTSLHHFFYSTEDQFQPSLIGKSLRILRLAAFLISLLAPSLYIAMMTHHQGLIPTSLLISLYSQREGVPFPALVEALIMEVTFEILREAGVRMPRAIGQAVSIVGALVIGQTAVQAGLVSTAVVIVVSITAISSFTTPNYSLAIAARFFRFAFMFAAYFLGFYGLILACLIVLGHLFQLTSLETPYISVNKQLGGNKK